MEERILFKVNNEDYDIVVNHNETLLSLLRNKLGLTGTNEGCGNGDCGACTVIVNGKAVNSCLYLAMDINGKEVTTIEGLADGEKLHPLQEAFIEEGAVQCGYCTPGVIMAAKALLDENPDPTEEEIRKGISGNLCRCTGYIKIIKGISSAAQKMK